MSTSAVRHDYSVIDNRPPTVGRQFLDRVRESPQREAFRYPVGEQWESVTWQEAGDRVAGSPPGWSRWASSPSSGSASPRSTRFEWILADLAIMCAGAATTTVYPSTDADDVGYILADSECRVVFAEDDTRSPSCASAAPSCRTGRKVVTVRRRHRRRLGDRAWPTWRSAARQLLAEQPGRRRRPDRRRSQPGRPGDADLHLRHHRPAQGRPAGHDNWTYEGAAIEALGILAPGRPAVPLAAAVARRSARCCCPPSSHAASPPPSTAGSTRSSTTWPSSSPTFMAARAADLREGARPGRHHAARPRAASRPRSSTGRSGSAARSTGCSARASRARPARPAARGRRQAGVQQDPGAVRRPDPVLRLRLGGAARDVAEWFHAAGILILEGYGLTETTRGHLRQPARRLPVRHASARRCPAPRSKIADDGEMLLRGPGVMRGYHNLPEATAEVLDATAGCTPATSARSTRRLPADHRPEEGPDQDLRRQVRRPAARSRSQLQGALPATPASSSSTATGATSASR